MLNPMYVTTLNDDTVFIFRKGMILRQWQVDKLFNEFTRPETYPEYIRYYQSGSIVGVDEFREVKEAPVYNAKMFKMGCPKLFELYPEEKVIDKEIIERLSDMEFRAAFFSGYLKYDVRGYYFDTSIRALKGMVDIND